MSDLLLSPSKFPYYFMDIYDEESVDSLLPSSKFKSSIILITDESPFLLFSLNTTRGLTHD